MIHSSVMSVRLISVFAIFEIVLCTNERAYLHLKHTKLVSRHGFKSNRLMGLSIYIREDALKTLTTRDDNYE